MRAIAMPGDSESRQVGGGFRTIGSGILPAIGPMLTRMKTLEPITPAAAERIQTLIDAPTPMTLDRLDVLATDSDSLSQAETIAGLAHVLRIANASLLLVASPEPSFGPADDRACGFCRARRDDGLAHGDDCPWFQLVRTIEGR